MELWRDLETSSFYLLDKVNGIQKSCNKYGEPPVNFKAYTSGFGNMHVQLPMTADSNYRVQPKKFDGYFQCPRPASHAIVSRQPYIRDIKQYKIKRLPNDVTKIPKPVTSLGFSRVYDNTARIPLLKSKTPKESYTETQLYSIENIKKTQEEVPVRDIKTASDMFRKHNIEKDTMKGYQAPSPKLVRRQLKGFFMVGFPTSSDLFVKEKKVLEVTNPVAIRKQKHIEAVDLKNLVKRREQRILKNKLIQS
ncbi:hypothetical protein SteCoe_16034 [Stentor coeruleus]|uniref:Uncharacterized protein n=1 Tax=Stentor coeruleus TaxID=5963 RepID=A0A1R2C241_9CILI|nr:hypothetical protein SteCoe_16034 [Stentor coeruleus]